MLKKRRFKEKKIVKVTFSLPGEPDADAVHLVGDFTDWQGRPMQRQKDGGWKANIDLPAGGVYQFRYLIDGERWMNDPEADGYTANPFGEENSVVET